MTQAQAADPDEREVFAALGKFAVGAVAIIGSVLLSGFVLQCLWGWFLTPTFGLAVPSLPLCLGLALLARTVVPRQANKPVEIWELAVHSFASSLVFLAFGWLIHLFV